MRKDQGSRRSWRTHSSIVRWRSQQPLQLLPLLLLRLRLRLRLRLPLLLLQDRNTNLQYLYPARDGLRGFTKAILYEWEAREEWEKGCWFGRSANWDERRVVPMVAIS